MNRSIELRSNSEISNDCVSLSLSDERKTLVHLQLIEHKDKIEDIKLSSTILSKSIT